MNRLLTIFFFILSISSCSSQDIILEDTEWYKIGSMRTQNKFSNNISGVNKNNDYNLRMRSDAYTKLSFKSNSIATEEFIDKNSEEVLYKITGDWTLINDTLHFKGEFKNSKIQRKFILDTISNEFLKLKIVSEIIKVNDTVKEVYDLSERERRFQILKSSLGLVKQFQKESEIEYRADDYKFDKWWEIRNFGKFIILDKKPEVEVIEKFPTNIQDVMYGRPWNYVPIYQSIFEVSEERVVFFDNQKLEFIYQDLSSRSEGCGTLSHGYFDVNYYFDPKEMLITLDFSNKSSIPIELNNLFKNKNLKTLQYEIVANNNYVMIWELR